MGVQERRERDRPSRPSRPSRRRPSRRRPSRREGREPSRRDRPSREPSRREPSRPSGRDRDRDRDRDRPRRGPGAGGQRTVVPGRPRIAQGPPGVGPAGPPAVDAARRTPFRDFMARFKAPGRGAGPTTPPAAGLPEGMMEAAMGWAPAPYAGGVPRPPADLGEGAQAAFPPPPPSPEEVEGQEGSLSRFLDIPGRRVPPPRRPPAGTGYDVGAKGYGGVPGVTGLPGLPAAGPTPTGAPAAAPAITPTAGPAAGAGAPPVTGTAGGAGGEGQGPGGAGGPRISPESIGEDWTALGFGTAQEGINWANQFAAEHDGNFPWEEGTMSPENNLQEHLGALKFGQQFAETTGRQPTVYDYQNQWYKDRFGLGRNWSIPGASRGGGMGFVPWGPGGLLEGRV